jgi:predicted RNase H-like HicB family nuclease
MTLTVEIHDEDGVLWGQVIELPGCFATGENLDELTEALSEAIALYQAETPSAPSVNNGPSGQRSRYQVDRMTLVDV